MAARDNINVLAAGEKPQHQSYTKAQIDKAMKSNPDVLFLMNPLEQMMGSRLTTHEMNNLVELVVYLALPKDVIYMLFCHCDSVAKHSDPTSHLNMRQVEFEAFHWVNEGITTLADAKQYIKDYNVKQKHIQNAKDVMKLGTAKLSAENEKFLSDWIDCGFRMHAIELAYDTTVMNLSVFNWDYCNAIIKSWHKAGLHTIDEIKAGDIKPESKPVEARPENPYDVSDEMAKYVYELHQYHSKLTSDDD